MRLSRHLRSPAVTQLYEDRWRIRAWLFNYIATWIPLIGVRMFALAAVGVQMEDREHTTVLLGTRIWVPESVTIGADSVVGRECRIEAGGGVTIGRSANIAHGVRLQTGSHDIREPSFPALYKPIRIGDHSWICEAATIIGGVTVGEGAVVTAGAVVTKDVEPWTVVGGVPAREIGTRPIVRYSVGWRPDFN